jgi:photosystem II stability/assembly factor-like uncharacterized protein
MINRRLSFTIVTVLFLCPVFLSAQTANIPLQWEVMPGQEERSIISFRGIAAVSRNEAWVSGSEGKIYHTANGGASWASITLNSNLDFRDIEWLPDGSLVAMSAGPGRKSRIYRSDDDGKSWKLSYQNNQPEAFYDGITFLNSQLGYLIGDPVENELFILQTPDGGRSWQRVDATSLPRLVPGEYGFAASGTGICGLNKSVWIVTGGSASRIIYNAIHQKKWEAFSLPLASGNSSSGAFSVAFADNQNGVVVGGDYARPGKKGKTVAYTRDGGKSWKLAKNHTELGYHSCVVYSAEANIYLAVSRSGESIYSTDGGRSWNNFGKQNLYTLSVAADGTIWGAGPGGSIVRLIYE